jgi:hypothetical protein
MDDWKLLEKLDEILTELREIKTILVSPPIVVPDNATIVERALQRLGSQLPGEITEIIEHEK